MEVTKCSDEVAEVMVHGGTGFRFAVRLHEKTCTCRKWQVSGIPCLHAIAFITSLDHAPLENYVDLYYSVQKFRTAYVQLIPALNHGFFMHPPLLKSMTRRRKNERYKGNAEGTGITTGRKGQHRCPIYKGYGHHWHSCKKGDPVDIAAMMAVRGPPKKKKRTSATSTKSSIVPFQDEGSTCSITFPPSKNIEPVAAKKRKSAILDSARSIRSRSGSCTNQLEVLSIEYPSGETQDFAVAAATTNARRKKNAVPKSDERA